MGRGSHKGGGMPSQRQLRVGELVRKSLSECLTRGEIRDPLLEMHVISIPEVRMSPDLSLATAYVMPLGAPGQEQPIVDALNSHKKYLRGRLGRDVAMKHTPDLRFRYDETFDEASRIDALLSSPLVQQDLLKKDDVENDDEK
ncbi:30S ribosome-binding factor RbfA [Cohaesibacter celericrescens]|uniref:Ribosome-binding factor A n=1 Tax=Cohaesibacter celericrescens TaxID=2067669 RepID=A0A2N5XNS0_9HYPH|nr:30S ribosome-binding factor RbfA [Cohaesibacter celericrescens]PLW76176.1 30S ribosome-binding factor RbfA [Cohaesibacter celericrescens]